MGNSSGPGIHPAPLEFTEAQIATDPILHFFHYGHLPPALRSTSQMFCETARYVVNHLPRNAERTVALRKLLEAKDAAVRANLPAPVRKGERIEPGTRVELGEPVEVGGHDIDREGAPPFGS